MVKVSMDLILAELTGSGILQKSRLDYAATFHLIVWNDMWKGLHEGATIAPILIKQIMVSYIGSLSACKEIPQRMYFDLEVTLN